MNITDQEQLTELLIKHDYLIKCVVSKQQIVASYSDVFNVKYTIYDKDDMFYMLSASYGDRTEIIILSKYLVRWYIFLDIIRLAKKHNLSRNIIRFFNVNGEAGSLDEMLEIELNQIDSEIEAFIASSVIEILKDNDKINDFDDKYIKYGVFHNFSILKGLLI